MCVLPFCFVYNQDMRNEEIRVVIRHVPGSAPYWKVLGPGWTDLAADARGAVVLAANKLGAETKDDSYRMIILWMDVPSNFREPDMEDFEAEETFPSDLVC